MQTFEQRAVMLIGFAAFWSFILIVVGRDSGWYAVIGMSIPIPIVLGVSCIPLYYEWKIIAKGEYCAGSMIAHGPENVFQKFYTVEIEFFINEVRYTTAFPISAHVYESLTGAECTVYCLEIKDKKRCVVRNFSYDKSYCSGGISLPEKSESDLQSHWYCAFTDKELADRAEMLRTHKNSTDYRNLYQ